jgi:outer membrane protein OmpA-like peptidoglycan-associated protein
MKTLLLAGVASIGLMSSAQAQEGNWYGGAGFGANWLDESEVEFTGFPTVFDVEYDTGWVMTGAVGYRWDYLRLEFELAYRDNESESVTPVPFVANTLFADTSYFSQMINLVWDIPLGDNFRLSLGGGIGGAQVNYDLGGVFGVVPYSIDDDDYVFAYQAIAGIAVDISDHMELFVEYRYFGTDEFEASGNSVPPGFPIFVNDDPASQSALIGVRYHFFEPEPPAPETPPQVEAPPPKTYIVFFDFNKSNLTAEAQSVVAEASEAYKATGSARVLVVGHTDTVGSASYNQSLSERRAANVKAEMVRLGVPADAISTEGRGFSDPMVPTGPGVREPQNRRAVIELE